MLSQMAIFICLSYICSLYIVTNGNVLMGILGHFPGRKTVATVTLPSLNNSWWECDFHRNLPLHLFPFLKKICHGFNNVHTPITSGILDFYLAIKTRHLVHHPEAEQSGDKAAVSSWIWTCTLSVLILISCDSIGSLHNDLMWWTEKKFDS